MAQLTIKILHSDGTEACSSSGEDRVCLVFSGEYREGDAVVLETSEKNLHLLFQPDDALGASLVYLTENSLRYDVPFGEKKVCYSPKIFTGSMHYLYARLATGEEIGAYRNLALNAADQHGETHCYPHASANVETRGESVFAARNAIDGVVENRSHGIWPYSSWGINRDPDACFKLEFGREVEIDKIVLYTRADFPHDSWWESAVVAFSDGSEETLELKKESHPQAFDIKARTVEWLTLRHLKKADDPSPFPALTQFEAWGTEAAEQ